MPHCPRCRAVVDADARFCPECGESLPVPSGQAAFAATAVFTPSSAGSANPGADRSSIPSRLKLPTLIGERYLLAEVCGGGGMAQVYRAIDQNLGREVAVKVIDPVLRNEKEFDARFRREVNILSRLSDPHIVVAHDAGIDAQCGPYLVMEYLRGKSLREALLDEPYLPVPTVLQIASQVLLALLHAHERNIIHRDIKPDNIFLLAQGSGRHLHARVLDFGIARIYRGEEGDETSDRITLPGAVLGTPKYMAPEQQAGQKADALSDVYSLGLVLYEALTGQLPKSNQIRLLELRPDAPRQLEQLLCRILSFAPGNRPSVTEVYDAVVKLMESVNVSSSSSSKSGASSPSVRLTSGDDGRKTIILEMPMPSRGRLVFFGMLGVSVILALATLLVLRLW